MIVGVLTGHGLGFVEPTVYEYATPWMTGDTIARWPLVSGVQDMMYLITNDVLSNVSFSIEIHHHGDRSGTTSYPWTVNDHIVRHRDAT